jgi:hypothetical protein
MLDKFNLLDRIISVSDANNNNCNFGGVKWRGKNMFLQNYEILQREV